MRRLMYVAVVSLFAFVPAASQAQQSAPSPRSGGLSGGQIVALAIVAAAAAAVAWYALAGTALVTAGAAVPAGELATGAVVLEPVVAAEMATAAEIAAARAAAPRVVGASSHLGIRAATAEGIAIPGAVVVGEAGSAHGARTAGMHMAGGTSIEAASAEAGMGTIGSMHAAPVAGGEFGAEVAAAAVP